MERKLGEKVFVLTIDDMVPVKDGKYPLRLQEKEIVAIYNGAMTLHSRNFVGISEFDFRQVDDEHIFNSKEEFEVYFKNKGENTNGQQTV